MSMLSNLSSLVSFAGQAMTDAVNGIHHDMADHVFTPGSYGPSRLYYQGDVPVLELQSDIPYEAGKAHGYLMGGSLQQMFGPLRVLQMVSKLSPQTVTKTLTAIRQQIPQEYLDEMRGIVDGFNQWRSENNWVDRREISEDELLLLHLMPDQCHFDPREIEATTKKQTRKSGKTVACTVVIARDAEKGITFGRNMDWPTFGVGILGTRSLIINRKYATPGKRSTAEVGFPGLVGTITGMNDSGVSLAMNVCSGDTREIRGMPAAFFNRACLERAKTVDDIAQQLKTQRPLGSYHLSAADPAQAKSFHLFQGTGEKHVVRELQGQSPLIVTNCRYPTANRVSDDFDDSFERAKVITALFKKAAEKKPKKSTPELVRESLRKPLMNRDITIHAIEMYPASRRMSVAFDNHFAASIPLHAVDTTPFFGRVRVVEASEAPAAPLIKVSGEGRTRHPRRAKEKLHFKEDDTDSE